MYLGAHEVGNEGLSAAQKVSLVARQREIHTAFRRAACKNCGQKAGRLIQQGSLPSHAQGIRTTSHSITRAVHSDELHHTRLSRAAKEGKKGRANAGPSEVSIDLLQLRK